MTRPTGHGKRGPFTFLAAPLVFLALFATMVDAEALDFNITSSPNPVGSGARALGMGGAFIAVADDATAASWNPGGLIQLERPEISVVGEGLQRSEDNHFKGHPEASGAQTVSRAGLNYLSAAYPFAFLHHNMILSINYQHLYDFSRAWNLTYATRQDRHEVDYEAHGGLYAWGIAYCIEVIPEFSFGINLNIWEDGFYRNGWETESSDELVHTLPKLVQMVTNRTEVRSKFVEKNRYSFSGFNANLGFLWNITDRLTLGGVFKTPFTADLQHEYSYVTRSIQPAPGAEFHGGASSTRDEKLDMPMSYGIGFAYRFSDRFTLSADLYRTHWEDFVLEEVEGVRRSPITKGLAREADIDPTTQVRLGGEYLFIRPGYSIPVRAGFFYDPAPARGSPDDYYGFTLGTGIGVGGFVFDAAYVYRFGRGVAESTIPSIRISQDVDEHSLYTSLIIHF